MSKIFTIALIGTILTVISGCLVRPYGSYCRNGYYGNYYGSYNRCNNRYVPGADAQIIAEAIRQANIRTGCAAIRVVDVRSYGPRYRNNREQVIVVLDVCGAIISYRLLGCTGRSCFFRQDNLRW